MVLDYVHIVIKHDYSYVPIIRASQKLQIHVTHEFVQLP